MATFMAYYQTGDYGKLWFEAENLEEADYLLSRVEDEKLSIDDLPKVENKVQGDEFSYQGLTEVK